MKTTVRPIIAASFLLAMAGLSLFLRFVDFRRGFVNVKNGTIFKTTDPELFFRVTNFKVYFAAAAFGGAVLLLIPVFKSARGRKNK